MKAIINDCNLNVVNSHYNYTIAKQIELTNFLTVVAIENVLGKKIVDPTISVAKGINNLLSF